MYSNPFTMRSIIKDDDRFFGRKQEKKEILTRLQHGQSCSIIGEHKIGKSSLLYNIVLTGKDYLGKNFIFLYLDVASIYCQTIVSFLQKILKDLHLDSSVISDKAKPTTNLMIFDEAINSLQNDYQIILCLDDFEGFFCNKAEYNEIFFNHLRSMANHSRLCLITVSKNPLEIYAIEEKITSPFFNIFSNIELKNFQFDEVKEFIQYYHHIVHFTHEELKFIKSYFDPHPLKLNILCDYLIQNRENRRTKNEAIDEIRKSYEQFLGGEYKAIKIKHVIFDFITGKFLENWLKNLTLIKDLTNGDK